jgi:hypothetical protein
MVKKQKDKLLSELNDDEFNSHVFFLRDHVKCVCAEHEKRKKEKESKM